MKFALSLFFAQMILAGVGTTKAQSTQPNGNQPPISITIRALNDVVQAGAPVVMEIMAKNVSDRAAIFEIPDTTYYMAFDVRDSAGNPPLTRRGRALVLGEGRSFDDLPEGGGPGTKLIEPGKSITVEERVFPDIFDLTKPGSYTIQLQPWGHDSIKSNTVTVTVVQGAIPYVAPVQQPPISVTIQTVGGASVFPSGKVAVDVITKNITNHYTNQRTAQDKRDLQRFYRVDVQDSQGGTPPETDFGSSVGNRGDVPPHYLGQHVIPGREDLRGASYKPGEERTEVIGVNELYDLSKPSQYTIQVRRWDDETKTWVKSNIVTVKVTP